MNWNPSLPLLYIVYSKSMGHTINQNKQTSLKALGILMWMHYIYPTPWCITSSDGPSCRLQYFFLLMENSVHLTNLQAIEIQFIPIPPKWYRLQYYIICFISKKYNPKHKENYPAPKFMLNVISLSKMEISLIFGCVEESMQKHFPSRRFRSFSMHDEKCRGPHFCALKGKPHYKYAHGTYHK